MKKSTQIFLMLVIVTTLFSCKKETPTPAAQTPAPTTVTTADVTFKQYEMGFNCSGSYWYNKQTNVRIANTYNDVLNNVFIISCPPITTPYKITGMTEGVYWYKSYDELTSVLTCSPAFVSLTATKSFTVTAGVNTTITAGF